MTETAMVTQHFVNLANTGGPPRSEWVEIGLPPAVVDELTAGGSSIGLRIDGGNGIHRCFLGRRLPDVAFVRADLSVGSYEQVRGALVSYLPQEAAEPFALHQFVGDDLSKLLLSFEVEDSSGVGHALGLLSMPVEIVERTDRRMVATFRGVVPGTPINVTVNAYACHKQAHVRIEVFVGMGGIENFRNVVSYEVRRITMRSGEAVVIEHAKRCGVSDPVRGRGGDWFVQLSGPRFLGRAEQLPFFGWMLCLPSTAVADDHRVDANFRSLMQGATCRATYLGWDGNYSTLGHIPQATGDVDRHAVNGAHMASMQQRGDMFDQRPLGLAKNAGQTGAQDDFGTNEDQVALRQADPRRQDALQFSCHGWFLRPFHNRDDRGFPVRFGDHPRFRTWSQIPERRVGSADQVGWPDTRPYHWPCSDYSGMDDQHRSQELLTCWGHLVDSHAVQQTLFDMVQVDVAQANVANGWSDTPRAEGRCLSSWADMLGLIADVVVRLELQEHANRRLGILDRGWPGRGLPEDRVRPLHIGSSPSLEGGHATPAVVVWEHSIAAMGFYDWWQRTGNDVAMRLCKAACELVVKHGIFQAEGQWRCAQAFKWLPDGVPLPQGDYRTNSPTVVSDAGGWWTWTLPAVLILAYEWPEHPAAAKARECLAAIGGPSTEDESEWWSVVPHRDWRLSVQPEPDQARDPMLGLLQEEDRAAVQSETKPAVDGVAPAVDDSQAPPSDAAAATIVEPEASPAPVDAAPNQVEVPAASAEGSVG